MGVFLRTQKTRQNSPQKGSKQPSKRAQNSPQKGLKTALKKGSKQPSKGLKGKFRLFHKSAFSEYLILLFFHHSLKKDVQTKKVESNLKKHNWALYLSY
jgi:hypothetical protein